MRVKGGNKTVLTTYPETDGEVLQKPDEGNLHVRFCEGAHSNLGAITSKKGALWALLDILDFYCGIQSLIGGMWCVVRGVWCVWLMFRQEHGLVSGAT